MQTGFTFYRCFQHPGNWDMELRGRKKKNDRLRICSILVSWRIFSPRGCRLLPVNDFKRQLSAGGEPWHSVFPGTASVRFWVFPDLPRGWLVLLLLPQPDTGSLHTSGGPLSAELGVLSADSWDTGPTQQGLLQPACVEQDTAPGCTVASCQGLEFHPWSTRHPQGADHPLMNSLAFRELLYH